MTKQKSVQVIVIGPSHGNALGVIRSLGEENVSPFFLQVGKKSNFVRHSKYISGSDSVDNVEEVIPYLLQHFSDLSEKPFLIPTSDHCSAKIDEAYHILSNKYLMPHANKSGDIGKMMDKQWQHNLANKCGLRTPQTWVIGKGSSSIPEGIQYPCFTKSANSLNGGKTNTHICNDANELSCIMEETTDTIQVQEFIKKNTELDLLGFVAPNGDVFIESGYFYLTFSETSYGNSNIHLSLGEIEKKFSIDTKRVKEFIRQTSYKAGYFSFEFLIDKENVAYFTELNLRNDAFTYGSTVAGCNLHYLLYKAIRGKSYDFSDTISPKTILADVSDFCEHVLTLHNRRSLISWYQYFKSHDCYTIYNKRDKGPVFAYAKEVLISYSCTLWHRLLGKIKSNN